MAGDRTADSPNKSAQAAIEGGSPEAAPSRGTGRKGPQGSGSLPPAGPHDDPSLVNPDATPGTGSLPSTGKHDDTDSTTG